jgi:K(+)-stimulated pyrophosphate-energized sodium pump
VIADNVGDNVGDVAGMGSDIFESYCGAMIATIAIASTIGMVYLTSLAPGLEEGAARAALMGLPLILASAGLICSLAGIAMVRALSAQQPALALRCGTIGAPLLFISMAYFVIEQSGLDIAIWWAVISGAVGGIVIGLVTEYYTSSTPIRRIAAAGETGPATVLITGLAVGMQSVTIPVLAICGIIFVSTSMAGLCGVEGCYRNRDVGIGSDQYVRRLGHCWSSPLCFVGVVHSLSRFSFRVPSLWCCPITSLTAARRFSSCRGDRR